jgi:CelD/BcsL family acetyltransferase involved in cellulose biosynthesis
VATGELIQRAEDLGAHLEAWDAMAVAAARPLASPKWLMPWLRHAAPAGAEPRVVAVSDGGELIGIAPFVVQRGSLGRADYRLFGVPFTERREPLAREGREDEVAAEVARQLAGASPRPSIVALEGIDVDSPWPDRLARHYPGPLRPMVSRRSLVLDTPTLSLNGLSFDDWMQSKSGNFRSQMRRMRRQLADDGGVVRMSDAGSDLERDIDAFMRLHLGRWEERGGSGLAEVRMDRMLLDAAGELLPEGRFRLWLVEIDGKAIGAGLFLAAGGELSYFNGGFDEEFARYKPTLQTILSALEDAFGRGEQRLDFGGGPQPYKLRFADSEAPLAWVNLRPRTARYPLTWAQVLRGDLRFWAISGFRKLPEERQERLKRVLRR